MVSLKSCDNIHYQASTQEFGTYIAHGRATKAHASLARAFAARISK